MYEYKTVGVCSSKINYNIENGQLKSVSFQNGCNGNLQGIGKLVEGMSIDAVIEKLDGIKCGHRNSSCPGQLAEALKAHAKGL